MTRSIKSAWLPLSLAAAAMLALVGWLAVAGLAQAADGSVSIDPATANVSATGDTTTVTVTAVAPAAKLGAWEIKVKYDPAKVEVTGCVEGDVGANVCNAAYAADTVDVAGASPTGASGTKVLATITVKAKGAAGTCSALTVTAPTFADPNATATNPTVTGGEVCVLAPATPTPTLAPTTAPTASPTAAALPKTGGSPSDSTSLTPWLLAVLGLVVVSGGAWVVARTRR